MITPITNPDAHLEMYPTPASGTGDDEVCGCDQPVWAPDAHGAGPGPPGCAHSENAVWSAASDPNAAPSWTTSSSTTPRGPRSTSRWTWSTSSIRSRTFRWVQPRYFANPVEKTHNGVVTSIFHAEDFLVCYDIGPQTFTTSIQTNNQFGPGICRSSRPTSFACPARRQVS